MHCKNDHVECMVYIVVPVYLATVVGAKQRI